MNKQLITFVLSLFFIINSSLGFSQTIHEDQIGLENSVELKSRIPQEFSAKSGSKTRSSVTVDISFDVLVIIGSLGKGFCIF